MSKKGKRKGAKKIKVTATPTEYRESALCCGQLAMWACAAFGMEQNASNARSMYALAWERARDVLEMEAFASEPCKKR